MDNPEQMEVLAGEAKVCIESGGHPDNLVLQAIGLGAGTRREIKEGLKHFGYDVIEKALERQSAEIRSNSQGPIERFELVGARNNRNGEPKAIPFNPKSPERASVKAPPTGESLLTCASCGKPRSPGSGRRCRACYEGRKEDASPAPPSPDTAEPERRRGATRKDLDLATVEEAMATEETVEKACKRLGVSTPTLYLHRKADPDLAAAIQRGRDRYYQNAPEINIDVESRSYEVSPPGARSLKIFKRRSH